MEKYCSLSLPASLAPSLFIMLLEFMSVGGVDADGAGIGVMNIICSFCFRMILTFSRCIFIYIYSFA